MPKSAGHDTVELLLCGHHYRASSQALLAAGAAVYDIDGMPLLGPGADRPALAAVRA